MGVNKMQVGQEVKFDLTSDTVTPQTLIRGVTAHNAAGDSITGEAHSIPAGGDTGEALVKLSSTDGDAAWGIPKSAGVEITQAQYDALSDAEKNNGTLYLITDANGVSENILDALLEEVPGINRLFRGKYLGDSVTAEQYAEIGAGTFGGLFVGDYWTIGGVNYRIADFDYFLRSGDTECTKHHAVIVPDTALYNAAMNTSNTTANGYTGSQMYTSNLANAKTTIRNAFGTAHILTHREYLENAVTNGKPSGGAWFDSDIELMSESMVYGGKFFEPTSDGSTVPAIYSMACKQFNLFRFRPDLISNRITYWLRNVVSAMAFALAHYDGLASYYDASARCGVRPEFCIKE